MAGGKFALITFFVILLIIQHEDMVRPVTADSEKIPRAPSIGRNGIYHLKKVMPEAFRPTTPSNSPGIGHGHPPPNPNH
ncbi:hypothetical protein SAY87_016555 [Trapa incisa]|uniref:Uncharacterized protein n=1 Tax=Trapa incisa TaxID=236973 RepID=A0AAN7LA98_9MYRT|nr:hypothetical protein SAY87_016555 [Trapa incisa]